MRDSTANRIYCTLYQWLQHTVDCILLYYNKFAVSTRQWTGFIFSLLFSLFFYFLSHVHLAFDHRLKWNKHIDQVTLKPKRAM